MRSLMIMDIKDELIVIQNGILWWRYTEEYGPCLLLHWQTRCSRTKCYLQYSRCYWDQIYNEGSGQAALLAKELQLSVIWSSTIWFSCFLTQTEAYSFSLGQGERKGKDPSVGPDRRYSGRMKVLFAFLFVSFVYSKIKFIAERQTLSGCVILIIFILMGGIV